MAKDPATLEELHARLEALIALSRQVVEESSLLKNKEKVAYLKDYTAAVAEAAEMLRLKKKSFLRQLTDEVLTPWNETFDADSKKFWALVQAKELPFAQRDFLAIILARGRLASFAEYSLVDEAIVLWQQEGRLGDEDAARLSAMLASYSKRHSQS